MMTEAYTQGLVYDNGMLYESTGLEGKSSVRIVNISTGKPEKMIAAGPSNFLVKVLPFLRIRFIRSPINHRLDLCMIKIP